MDFIDNGNGPVFVQVGPVPGELQRPVSHAENRRECFTQDIIIAIDIRLNGLSLSRDELSVHDPVDCNTGHACRWALGPGRSISKCGSRPGRSPGSGDSRSYRCGPSESGTIGNANLHDVHVEFQSQYSCTNVLTCRSLRPKMNIELDTRSETSETRWGYVYQTLPVR
jgi:hypothetical protein